MSRSTDNKDVLEQNVSTLLETGGEAPKISDIAKRDLRFCGDCVDAANVAASEKPSPVLHCQAPALESCPTAVDDYFEVPFEHHFAQICDSQKEFT